jgi:hypothetical protein
MGLLAFLLQESERLVLDIGAGKINPHLRPPLS